MKKIIALILTALLLFSLASCASGSLKQFTVIVVHSDGTEKEFSYRSTDEFLATTLLRKGLIQTVDGDDGMEVTEADGEKLEDGATWIAFEGEYYVEQPLDITRIMDGTVYKLVYTPAAH